MNLNNFFLNWSTFDKVIGMIIVILPHSVLTDGQRYCYSTISPYAHRPICASCGIKAPNIDLYRTVTATTQQYHFQ